MRLQALNHHSSVYIFLSYDEAHEVHHIIFFEKGGTSFKFTLNYYTHPCKIAKSKLSVA